MRFLFRMFFWCLLLAVVAGGYVYYRLSEPYAGFSESVFVDFAHGTGTSEIADILAQKGVVEQRWMFLAARLFRGGILQAGEYKFDKPATPLEVYSKIARGDIFYLELLLPEGFNMFDMAPAVAKLGTIKAADFLAAARKPGLIRDLDPRAASLEGYLFPSKYRIYRRTTAEQLCRLMTDEFRRQWKNLNTHEDVHDIVTLASLVEREARLPEDRPNVASVFANRLRLGVKLDCDPTTVYAALLENRYRGAIHRSDLDNPSPWNTYRHAGLPPGPIANPGLSSIKAALRPAETNYLYFVAKADGSGGHTFSETLAQHEAAVASYRASGR
ncbi:MAG: endolytic transglycosylase MltG [Terriglobia bacterium]